MVLFGTLNTSYSGLTASQVAVDVTGNNISNANTEGYTRQRALMTTSMAISSTVGSIGTGVRVQQIARVFDEYAFDRYRDSSASLAYSDLQQQTLQEVSTYFPDVTDKGLQQSLSNYFTAWTDLASNPSSASNKTALSQATQTLGARIQETRAQVSDLQKSLDGQLQSMVDEVNSTSQKIANLNKQIFTLESDGVTKANDLRDQRDQLELNLSKLMGVTVTKGQMVSDTTVGTTQAGTYNYVVQVNGFNIVDGTTFHPIGTDATGKSSGYASIYFQTQDYTRYDLTSGLSGGKIGSILDLRGRNFDTNGVLTDGKLQKYIDMLDTMAGGLIQSSNNIYAASAQTSMVSNASTKLSTDNILTSGMPISKGSFDLVVYDKNGKESARRTVTVDPTAIPSAATPPAYATSYSDIVTILTDTTIDDNGDNVAGNDVGNMIAANVTTDTAGKSTFSIGLSATGAAQGMSFAIVDSGTNFAGALGLGRYFDGTNASDIALSQQFVLDSDKINAYAAPINGDNTIATAMQQLQYDKVALYDRNGGVESKTISDYYQLTADTVATDTAAANQNYATVSALNTATKQANDSVTKVNMDEELTNLMKYQTGYSANAKVITAIDKMMETLLGMKQ